MKDRSQSMLCRRTFFRFLVLRDPCRNVDFPSPGNDLYQSWINLSGKQAGDLFYQYPFYPMVILLWEV